MKQSEIYLAFVKNARESQKKARELAKEMCRAILSKCKDKRVDLNPDNDDETDTPCTNYTHCSFTDDVASVNVYRVWLDKDGFMYADLFYYYESEIDENMYLEEDDEFDWFELLN